MSILQPKDAPKHVPIALYADASMYKPSVHPKEPQHVAARTNSSRKIFTTDATLPAHVTARTNASQNIFTMDATLPAHVAARTNASGNISIEQSK